MQTKRLFLKTFGALLIAALLFAALPAGEAMAQVVTTRYVNSDGICEGLTPCYTTIQAAINAASPGDTISVAAGIYSENYKTWVDIELYKSVNIIGAGSGQTIVELTGKQHGLAIRPDATGEVVVQGITFTKPDGAIKSADWGIIIGETGGTFQNVVLRDVEVAYAQARNLAFLNATYNEITIENSNFHHSGAWGASARGTIHTMTITNSDFDNNGWSDAAHGIGFDIDMPTIVNHLTVVGGTFNNNTSKGINLVKTSNATFENITASNNGGAPGGGFGVSVWEWSDISSNLNFINPILTNNATDGFLIGSETGKVVSNVAIEGGTITSNGRGGLFVYRDTGWGEGVIENVSIIGAYIDNIQVIMPYEDLMAIGNWFGTGDPAIVPTKVTSGVVYNPWCYTADCSELYVAAGGSIQEAIDIALPGGTIHVGPGTYNEKLIIDVPNLTIQSTDGADATIIEVPDGTNTIGVYAMANMGDLTFDGFTVKAFTMAGIVQPMSQHENTAFHVLNNKVIPTPEYLRNGIQVSGDNSTIINNYVLGYRLTEDWASTAIMVVNASNVLVQGNVVDGGVKGVTNGINVQNHSGVVNNITIKDNEVTKADYGVRVEGNYWAAAPNRTVTNVTVQNNIFDDNKYGVGAIWVDLDTILIEGNTIKNSSIGIRFPTSVTNFGDETTVTNATISSNEMSLNTWQVDARGSVDLDLESVIENNVLDKAFLAVNQRIIYSSFQDAIGAASPGDTIVLDGTYNIPGGMEINVPGLTILLKDKTIIQNSSACFIVNASNTTITTETIGGATCVPTGGDHGIVVAGGLEQIEVLGLEIDGTGQTTGDGIHFLGDIKHVWIVNNLIHNLERAAVHFTALPDPTGLLSIQGNLFMDNASYGVFAPGDLDVAYNAWGKLAGPDSGDLPAYMTSFVPFTHVDLRLETSGTVYADQVVIGDQITFTVYGNLAHVSGVEFDLTHAPDAFAYVPGSFEFNEIVFDEAGFNLFPYKLEMYGYQWVYVNTDPPITGINVADTWLFRVTFDATQLGKTWSAGFEGDTNFAFAHEIGDGGPTNHIYAADLVGVDPIEVIALPTLSQNGLEVDFVAGWQKTFDVTIANPLEGGVFTNVLVNFRLLDTLLTDIHSFQCYDSTLGAWLDMPLSQDVNDVVGYWGPPAPTGFPVEAPYNATTDCSAVFMEPGSYDVEITLDDLAGSWELAKLTQTVTVLGDFTVTGTVSMQGRTVRSGVPMTLTAISFPVYGPFQEDSGTAMVGNLVFTLVNGGTYRVTTNQPRYLNLHAGLELTFDVVNGDVELPPLHLFGGNADWVDNYEIDISDASIVGTDYGKTIDDAADVNADVNFDGKINIQDLALVGGNFGLTSQTAYSGWLD